MPALLAAACKHRYLGRREAAILARFTVQTVAVQLCLWRPRPIAPGEEPAMLVLSRKVGERILIGENISVTVVRVGPGVVRLGIDAPPSTPIVREEIKDQLRDQAPKDPLAANP
jgi:carbon storage regulator